MQGSHIERVRLHERPSAYRLSNVQQCRVHACGALSDADHAVHTNPHESTLFRHIQGRPSPSRPRLYPFSFATRTVGFKKKDRMSGLEVAGLVLGAFPIAIEILDRYKEVARRLGFWYKIAAEHKKCDSQLKYHKLLYENNLKRLLLPLTGLEDKQIDKLLQNPAGSCWSETRTAECLEKRLGSSYEVYLQCMDEIHSWLKAMNHELSFDASTTKLPQVSTPVVSS